MATDREIMYRKIYNDLLEGIRDRTYRIGDRLPSEKELTELYGVSRITAKKALEMLSEEGLISRMRGRGSYVTAAPVDSAGKAGLQIPRGKEIPAVPMVGVILDSFGSDFGSGLIKSMERECRKKGYSMLLRCTYGSIEEEDRAIRSAVELGVSGLIMMCVHEEAYNTTIIQLSLEHFPIVLVDRQMQGISIPCVMSDNYRGAYDLTELLIRKGHRKICFVSHSSLKTPTVRERYEGFADCILARDGVHGQMQEISGYNPVPQDEQEEFRNYDREELRALLEKNKDCSAFFAVEYKLGMLLRLAMKERKDEREVVTFDGLDRIYGGPCFTHVKQDELTMGIRAVETVDQLIHGKEIRSNIKVPHHVIER